MSGLPVSTHAVAAVDGVHALPLDVPAELDGRDSVRVRLADRVAALRVSDVSHTDTGGEGRSEQVMARGGSRADRYGGRTVGGRRV